MKLRNKKSGEIIEFDKAWLADNYNTCMQVSSLAELNAEWEDYEEPKECWFIDIRYPKVEPKKDINLSNSMRKRLKEIGNYFGTREEAEKAVEKLKAWKRLKDKGFRFDSWKNDKEKYLGDFVIYAHIKDLTDIIDELDLLFGGEDE